MTNYGKITKAFIDLQIGSTFTRNELMELAKVTTDIQTRNLASAIISIQVKMDRAIQEGRKGRYVIYKKLANPKSATQ